MYSIVLINAWALSITFLSTAPTWLSLYIPMGFTAICGARLVGWWRLRHVVPTVKYAHRALTLTTRLAFLLTVLMTIWALSLFPYGDPYMQGSIAFFIAITGLGVINCLQQLRSATIMVAIVVNCIFVAYFCIADITAFMGMAINLVLVSVALLLVMAVQFRHFAGAVSVRAELEAISRENARLANLDSLTELANRREFFARLEGLFDKLEGKRLAVGVIDLDGFKPVNDLYGHKIGDKLLVEVGKRLADEAGDGNHIARLGGDEFALTVVDCPDDTQLLALGERICAALRTPFVLAETTVQISGSIGFSVYPDTAGHAQELYERADYALYCSKRTSRGHPLLFTEQHMVEIEQNTRIEQALLNADLNAELTVFYQPIIAIDTGKTMAFEALARWASPVLGNVPPSDFIPVAERAGLISEMTRILLKKALTTASHWPDNVGLSFNLSAHDISSSQAVSLIVGTILASGVDPKRLDLELTETAMLHDFAQAKAAIDMLKLLGCGIALDDFGTGYSSLSQLHALPLTKIKIDRSFVSNLDRNPASYKIVKSLLALSTDMGLGCVVEGVETKEELAALNILGGRLVQGYFYSLPVPASELERFLPQTTGPAQMAG
ncbi:putative bifunctional diguanylate cyclase/phosphodiesterase [Hoeflea sp.]|uniref:putative bifunctional diguanylate cyclase/phosphodiesterase n=1 Tax=Hoeflea sp. TaxID=1940281 RepID=UPI003A957632